MKKKIKLVIASLIFCSLFAGCAKIFRYILIDDTASYTRVAFHEMYKQDNIDVLFAGSSHCYRAFIPEILDEELKLNTFNIGTSAQSMDGSYMVIKEAARYNDIKHIYLEVYYNIAFSIYKDRTEMTQTYIISDYLRPSFDKIGYMLNASTKDYYSNSFIVARRNWEKFFDADYVKNLIMKKQSDAYKNYEYKYITDNTEWYAGKGYVADKRVIGDWNYFSDDAWSDVNFDNVSDDWLNSLEDIIDFCDKKGISLTLVSAPMPNFLLAGLGNYDDYIELIQDIIADTEVDYYDFNLCREEYFPNTSSLFKDTGHVNCYGAEQFSHLFADFINGKIAKEELFYDSYEEKIRSLEPTVFGISYNDSQGESGETVRECKIVSTGNDDLEYKIVLTPNEGTAYVLQDFSNNNCYFIAPDDHGKCRVTYRLRSLPGEVRTVDISY